MPVPVVLRRTVVILAAAVLVSCIEPWPVLENWLAARPLAAEAAADHGHHVRLLCARGCDPGHLFARH